MLFEKLKIFSTVVFKFQIEARITIVLLVAGLRKEVQNLIGEVRKTYMYIHFTLNFEMK